MDRRILQAERRQGEVRLIRAFLIPNNVILSRNRFFNIYIGREAIRLSLAALGVSWGPVGRLV